MIIFQSLPTITLLLLYCTSGFASPTSDEEDNSRPIINVIFNINFYFPTPEGYTGAERERQPTSENDEDRNNGQEDADSPDQPIADSSNEISEGPDEDELNRMEYERSYQRAFEYVQRMQDEMCPICLATVPIFQIPTDARQDIEIKTVMDGKAKRKQGYKYFNIIKEGLQEVKSRFYDDNDERLLADAKAECNLIVRAHTTKQAKKQYYNNGTERRRYSKGRENAKRPAARRDGYKRVLDDLEKNDDFISCDAKYDYDASQLQLVLEGILEVAPDS